MAERKSTAARGAWTKDDVKLLRKLYRSTSTAEVAKELGRSQASVQTKASSLGLKKSKKYLKAIGRG